MTLNSVYKIEKLKKICENLAKNPILELNDLEKELSYDNYNMSVYEKIFVLKTEISFLNLAIDNYESKLNETQSFFENKKDVIRDKLNNLVQKRNVIQEQLFELEGIYTDLFEKSLKYYY